MSSVVFLRGVKTILRPPNKSDAQLFQKWVNDPEVRFFLNRRTPVTLEEEVGWIESLSRSQNQVVLVVETHEGTPIGTMGVHGIDWHNRRATTGAMIGEKNFWSGGYGTDAKMAFLNYLFSELNLHKVCSEVFAFNTRSYAYLKKTGYREEGRRIEDCYSGGKYHDTILMAIFKRDFMPLWRAYRKEHKL